MDDATWWLLDSGASITILAERYAKFCGIDCKDLLQEDSLYRAANKTK